MQLLRKQIGRRCPCKNPWHYEHWVNIFNCCTVTVYVRAVKVQKHRTPGILTGMYCVVMCAWFTASGFDVPVVLFVCAFSCDSRQHCVWDLRFGQAASSVIRERRNWGLFSQIAKDAACYQVFDKVLLAWVRGLPCDESSLLLPLMRSAECYGSLQLGEVHETCD